MWPLGEEIPQRVAVFAGSVFNKRFVCYISRGQALALWRWHGHKGLYFSYIDARAKYHDVRLCGDIDAWMSEEPLFLSGPHKKE